MSTDHLPKYTEQDYLGDKGVRLVERIVSDEIHWIFRDLRKNDLGVDGQIELVDEKLRGTGRLLSVQIKCGKSLFNETTEQGFVFRGDRKHLNYWLQHSLPIIVIICDPETNLCYWQEVSSANTVPLEKGWKMIIPYQNILSAQSEDELQRIAGRPQHRDIVELLLYQFLHEKYIRRIEVCSLFELPRDYHKYAYLAKIDDELVMIDFHYDLVGRIKVEDIEEIIRWKDYNNNVCGPNPLHIYIVTKSINALNLNHKVIEFLKSFDDVTYFRLIYRDDDHSWLDELDENNKPITFWP